MPVINLGVYVSCRTPFKQTHKTLGACGAALMVAMLLSSCGQMAAQQASTSTTACLNEVKSSPEGQAVYARLWVGDDTDNASKLSDPNPLTKTERDALVRVNNKLQRCRQIIIEHDNRFAAWETPYWQEFFQRTDAIHLKLAAGEIAVGVANKLIIESALKFRTDVSKGHAQAVSIEERRRQRA